MSEFLFLRVGEYIAFWPGVVLMGALYVYGVESALSAFGGWVKRTLYVLALTVSMTILFDFLQLVVPY